MKKIEILNKRVADQRKWIESCGGDLLGYIANYGDPNIPNAKGQPMFGDGGTLIYQADTQRLRILERELDRELHSYQINR